MLSTMRAVWWPSERRHAGHPRIRSWFVAACCALGGIGCREPANDALSIVYRLQLETIEGRGELSAHWIREGLDDAVRGSTVFVHGEAQRPSRPLTTRLRVAVLQNADGGELLRVELSVEDPPEHIRMAFGRDFEAVIELERLDGSIELDSDLPEALRRAVAVLETKALLVRGDPATLERLLVHPDPELVILAIDWIAGRRLRSHADAVATLVTHPDDRVALRAVECLGEVGTHEHARWLVAQPRLADRAHARGLYETLSGLGGPHALGFLEFAARNEDDPMLADLARRALERVRTHPAEGHARPVHPPLRGHR